MATISKEIRMVSVSSSKNIKKSNMEQPRSEIRVPVETSYISNPSKEKQSTNVSEKKPMKSLPAVKSHSNASISSEEVPKVKKRKRSSTDSYSTFIYRVLKQVHPDIGMTNRAMAVMNAFVRDLFERFAEEASKLAHYNKKNTLSSREVQTAAKLLLPGELAKHAISDATKALNKFQPR